MPRSRTGCSRCKKRRIKCDETHPVCNNCVRLGAADTCEYGGLVVYSASAAQSSSSQRNSPNARDSSGSDAGPRRPRDGSTYANSIAHQSQAVQLLQRFSPSHGTVKDLSQVTPLDILSGPHLDPFDALPVKTPGPHTLELLRGFFLVAYLETEDGISNTFDPGTNFYHAHVGGAISELRHALSTPGYMEMTDILYTTIHLGWASHMLGDRESSQVHMNGIATLISQHFDVWWNHPSFSKGRFVQPRSSRPMNEPPSSPKPGQTNPDSNVFWRLLKLPSYMTPSVVQSGVDQSHLIPSGFEQLFSADLIAVDLRGILPSLVCLERLLAKAHSTTDEFTNAMARDYFGYLYLNGWSLHFYEPMRMLDHLWRNCLTLYFYRMAFADPAVFPTQTAATILHILNACDGGEDELACRLLIPRLDVGNVSETFRTIGNSFPSVLVWIALLAGPVGGDILRPWYSQLLQIACANTYPQPRDFDEVLWGFLKGKWLWCDRLTPSARRFWDEAFGHKPPEDAEALG